MTEREYIDILSKSQEMREIVEQLHAEEVNGDTPDELRLPNHIPQWTPENFPYVAGAGETKIYATICRFNKAYLEKYYCLYLNEAPPAAHWDATINKLAWAVNRTAELMHKINGSFIQKSFILNEDANLTDIINGLNELHHILQLQTQYIRNKMNNGYINLL